MSLDLYITSKTPVSHKGTGVFVREDGTTVELTVKEIKEKWPDAKVEVLEYEDQYAWCGNITHNMGEMAEHVVVGHYTLYQLLWRPEETDLIPEGCPTGKYIELLGMALEELKRNKEGLLQYNPSNGWGDYDLLLRFTSEYFDHLARLHPLSEYTIEVSR